jgi:hypothetical protein
MILIGGWLTPLTPVCYPRIYFSNVSAEPWSMVAPRRSFFCSGNSLNVLSVVRSLNTLTMFVFGWQAILYLLFSSYWQIFQSCTSPLIWSSDNALIFENPLHLDYCFLKNVSICQAFVYFVSRLAMHRHIFLSICKLYYDW